MNLLDLLPRSLPALALGMGLTLASACSGGDDKDGAGDGGAADGGGADGGADGGGQGTTDSGATDDLPPKPEPFTLAVRGGVSLDLYFDTPTCQKPKGANNFRAFWRDSTGSHVFVLIADLLGSYTEPGTYSSADTNATIKLQEEAGGTGGFDYYATTTAQGDSASITIEHLDEEAGIGWGEFEFDGLHPSSGGGITASPMPIPIWCETLR